MNRVIRAGDRTAYEAADFWHSQKIAQMFDEARDRAWAMIQDDPQIVDLIREQKQKKIRRLNKKEETRTILSIYK